MNYLLVVNPPKIIDTRTKTECTDQLVVYILEQPTGSCEFEHTYKNIRELYDFVLKYEIDHMDCNPNMVQKER
jgi:hypothetical protein